VTVYRPPRILVVSHTVRGADTIGSLAHEKRTEVRHKSISRD
jgi:hypothetical protein